jgi:hypothetical protein
MRRPNPALTLRLTAPLALSMLLMAASPARPTDPRREVALELTVNITVADTDEERIALLKKLAAYRFDDVALALVQLAEEDLLSSAVMRELEWVLVAMGDLVLRPLADALAGRRIPSDFVTIVWKRIARQDPTLLVPYLNHAVPAVSHAAALAVATCNHPEALSTVIEHFLTTSAEGQAVFLEAGCLVMSQSCPDLLARARQSEASLVRSTALEIAAGNEGWMTDDAMATALHDNDINIVRAALTVLERWPAKGLVADLAILLKTEHADVSERALRALARAGTQEASQILQEVVRNHAASSTLGRIARELIRQGSGETVVVGDALDAVPISATLTTLADGSIALRLYNDEGFRVVVRGAIYVKCKGMPQSRTNVGTGDFSADGTLSLRVQCRSGGPPEVNWKRRDGQLIRAKIQNL